MVNSESMAKPPSFSSSSPEGLSSEHVMPGFANWSFTMVLLAACLITWLVRDAGQLMPELEHSGGWCLRALDNAYDFDVSPDTRSSM